MKITPELLKRFQANECTPEEAKAVEAWLNSAEDEPSPLSAPQLKRMERNIWERLGPAALSNAPNLKLGFAPTMLKYAAAILLLAATGGIAFWLMGDSGDSPDTNTLAFEGYQTVETSRGEKRSIALSDGSTIWLNYETTVKVPEAFTSTERIVYLEGHAHFDVAKDPAHPFIIYTEGSKTQVLGTSFDINTRGDSAETTVTVTSGRVAFSDLANPQNSVTLLVDDQAVLKPGDSIAIKQVSAWKLTSWKDNILYFEDQPFDEIIKVVEAWYDVRITVQDTSLQQQSFTFSDQDPSLEAFIALMSEVANFEYRINGNEVTIY
ncbi:MAG: FecR domain-containing protein [Bacteroidota bacterium]